MLYKHDYKVSRTVKLITAKKMVPLVPRREMLLHYSIICVINMYVCMYVM